MREIRPLRSMWRGLETESSDNRASPRPYRRSSCWPLGQSSDAAPVEDAPISQWKSALSLGQSFGFVDEL